MSERQEERLSLPRTDGAARGEQSSLWLSRVVKEVERCSKGGLVGRVSLVLFLCDKEMNITFLLLFQKRRL